MRKVCEDCHKSFECSNNRCVRCEECQEAYRKEFQKEYQKGWKEENPQYHKTYWHDKPNTHQKRYYQFWRFCTTLTDDEIRTLITERKQRIKHKQGDIKVWRTHIKILCDVYKSREEERKQKNIFWAYEDEERGGF